MILVDSGPLIALLDPRDRLNKRALGDLRQLAHRPLLVCAPVLVEVCFALPARYQRARLRDFIEQFAVRPWRPASEEAFWRGIFSWLDQYADHTPDLADAWLTLACAEERRLRVWTFDDEFRRIWRRPDGRAVPLAPRTG